MKKQIVLKKNEEHRIVSGHPWVFSNEIRETKGDPAVGDVVELLAANGRTLGIGFYNPHSLISLRLLSTHPENIDFTFFKKRIARSLSLRTLLYPDQQAFRIVNGEADFLPGLIIDKFNEILTVQTYSFGMDARLNIICDVLDTLLHPTGVAERNESPLRLLEGLPQKKGILRGEVQPTIIEEHSMRYRVDPLAGQKTGFFLDQRENRLTIRRFSQGASVLDCFCNDGGFSLNAARGGAIAVVGIDSSEEAIRNATANAELNSISTARFVHADVFAELERLNNRQGSFDLLVLDPPSFTKSKKNVQTAKRGYRELHLLAFGVLKKGGILLTASCSHHIEPDVFLSLIQESSQKAARSLQLLEWRGAAPDHPTLPAVPETRYLKFGVFRVN